MAMFIFKLSLYLKGLGGNISLENIWLHTNIPEELLQTLQKDKKLL